jgi:hypothetical protein
MSRGDFGEFLSTEVGSKFLFEPVELITSQKHYRK